MDALLAQLRDPRIEAELVIATGLAAAIVGLAVVLASKCGHAEGVCGQAASDCQQVLHLVPHF